MSYIYEIQAEKSISIRHLQLVLDPYRLDIRQYKLPNMLRVINFKQALMSI